MGRMNYFLSMTLCVTVLAGASETQQVKSKVLAELGTASVGLRSTLLKQLQSDPSVKLMDVIEAMSDTDPVHKEPCSDLKDEAKRR